MDDPRDLIPLMDHQYSDTKEEDDLDASEEKVDPRQLPQQVPAGDHQQENIERDEKKTPEIKGMLRLAPEMADRMSEEQDRGEDVEPNAIAFQPLKGRCDHREGNGIHKRSFVQDAKPPIFHKPTPGFRDIPANAPDFAAARPSLRHQVQSIDNPVNVPATTPRHLNLAIGTRSTLWLALKLAASSQTPAGRSQPFAAPDVEFFLICIIIFVILRNLLLYQSVTLEVKGKEPILQDDVIKAVQSNCCRKRVLITTRSMSKPISRGRLVWNSRKVRRRKSAPTQDAGVKNIHPMAASSSR